MKLIHLSDLHLGKRVNEYSMLEDQRYILEQILGIVEEEAPEAVLLAGDIYDKSVPPAEAVTLFDQVLTRLCESGRKVLIISGNHDSAERLTFGGRLMERSGVYLAPVYDGHVEPVRLSDEWGEVCVYLLPFVKPVHVREAFPEEEIASYTDALRAAVAHMDLDPGKRNVLVTHQFVAGASRSDSETVAVGGTDAVDGSVFDEFDYVALGHLHGPQSVGRETMRYCGTPLKYSFSEMHQKKSVTVVELGEKGDVRVRTRELRPLHDLREIRGTYRELADLENYQGTAVEDYLHVVLTDEEDVYDAFTRLRGIYPNLMTLDYDNARTRTTGHVSAADARARLSETELLGLLYEQQNGCEMNEEQKKWAEDCFAALRENENGGESV